MNEKKPLSTAERQRKYREKHLKGKYGPSKARVEMYLGTYWAAVLKEIAADWKMSQTETIERLLMNEKTKKELARAKMEEIAKSLPCNEINRYRVTEKVEQIKTKSYGK